MNEKLLSKRLLSSEKIFLLKTPNRLQSTGLSSLIWLGIEGGETDLLDVAEAACITSSITVQGRHLSISLSTTSHQKS